MIMNQVMGGVRGNADAGGGLPLSSDGILKATGLPPFLIDMFLGKQKTPPTAAERKTARLWKVIHTIFALAASIYTVFTLSRSVGSFGARPPAPPTVQNPFTVFIMGESIIQSTMIVNRGANAQRGIGLVIQILRELATDGCVLVFILGLWSWWRGLA